MEEDTPMLDRIAAGRTDLVFDWTAQGGTPLAVVEGASLAQWCAYYGDVSGLRHLLGQGVALDALGANLGLEGAAFHGHWRLCEFLLEAGADAQRPDPQTGETPLHAALCARQSLTHEQVVRTLLAAGTNPSAAAKVGAETGGFMRDARTRGETPLHRAAAYGTARAIEALLQAGADLEARDALGDTPLSWASWALRETEVLRMLCYGPYRVRADRPGMAANLIGHPLDKPDAS
jgi:hypothetical protein